MKTCQWCNAGIFGRSDKKYCDNHCRSAHYQQRQRTDAALLRRINRKLRQNRSLLARLHPQYRSAPIPLQALRDLGFDTNFHTHMVVRKSGSAIKMFYDYGLSACDDHTVRICKPRFPVYLMQTHDPISN
ncbi:MAG: hypothetical protein JPMHGGIA_01605 [Saprospiraceae bacterium]|jgi:hypothetical protein|nr:hypothetical protein [Saprospiraceae bacterium]MBV6473325.1 hypothetical protein [Saprospiraceae bacterium]